MTKGHRVFVECHRDDRNKRCLYVVLGPMTFEGIGHAWSLLFSLLVLVLVLGRADGGRALPVGFD